MELRLHYSALFSGRAEIEKHYAEQYNGTGMRDFVEPIDGIHISGDHCWFVAHSSATYVTQPDRERRLVKGYIITVLEKRNGKCAARTHATFPFATQ